MNLNLYVPNCSFRVHATEENKEEEHWNWMEVSYFLNSNSFTYCMKKSRNSLNDTLV